MIIAKIETATRVSRAIFKYCSKNEPIRIRFISINTAAKILSNIIFKDSVLNGKGETTLSRDGTTRVGGIIG